MYFCKDQEQAYDTQCCLFNSTAQYHKQMDRPSQDGLVGLQKPRISYKPNQAIQKSARLTFKNVKGENSQQKEKISLSKKSARRPGTYSHDHSEKKQDLSNMVGSNVSGRKLKPSESKPNSSVLNVDFSFNQLIPPTINQQSETKISFSNILPNQYQGQNKNLGAGIKNQNKVFQKSWVTPAPPPSVPLSYRASKNVNFQYISQPQYFTSPPPIVPPVKPQSQTQQIYQQNKPNSQAEQILVSSTHNNSQLNAYSVENINIKGVQTTAPTLQTDRNMIYSQVKQGNEQDKDHLSPMKNNSHIFARQQSEYAESRMVETVSPDLGRTHLKTVQSVYGSEIGAGKKEMQQSVILIDFFNPSEHLRKQIEDRIFNQRYPDNYA